MSAIVNSFVNDKLHNDQLVYDFVTRKFRQIHPSSKQDINFVVKQMVEHYIESSKIERVMLCVFSLFTYSLYDIQKVILHTSKIIMLILYLYYTSTCINILQVRLNYT